MAKQPSFFSQLWWMGLAVIALSSASIVLAIGALTMSGKVSKSALRSIPGVLRGSHLTIEKTEMMKYAKLQAAEDARLALERKQKGGGLIRAQSVEAERLELAKLKAERAVLKERLNREVEDLKKLRGTVEAGMLEADRKRLELNASRTLAAKRDLAKDTELFNKTLSTLDSEIISRDMESMVNIGSKGNAARLLKKLKPSKRSEVLGEMTEKGRLALLPLLENEYATIDPSKVVQDWKNKGLVAGEYQVFLESMPVNQAFRVWRQLDRPSRNEVLDLLAPAEREGRR